MRRRGLTKRQRIPYPARAAAKGESVLGYFHGVFTSLFPAAAADATLDLMLQDPPRLERLRQAVAGFTRLVDSTRDETVLLRDGRALLASLIATDDWLPDLYAQPDPERYTQYLLWCDPLERFSIVSFVWGPGQSTPVHDHTVWGLVGVLRGAESCTGWSLDAAGRLVRGDTHVLNAGSVDAVSPTIGDMHEVANARSDAPSISIHVYGANIGRVNRHVYKQDGERKSFISGYTARPLPNIWID